MNLLDIHKHSKSQTRSDTIYSLNHDELSCYKPDKYYSIGIHPWHISEDINWDELYDLSKAENVVAIGECGLDKLCNTPLKEQENYFIKQVEISEAVKKPLIIHMVRTTDEILRIKRDLQPKQQWIIHGFRGKPQLAESYIHQGIIPSFGEKFNPETVRKIPLRCLLLETDESNLTIEEVTYRVAQTIDIENDKLANIIKNNSNRIFNR